MAFMYDQITLNFLKKLYDKYHDELYSDFFQTLRNNRESEKFGFDGQMSDVNGNLTYMMIREFKPNTILEFSCSRGYTTLVMLEAVKKNGFGHLYGLEPGYECKDKQEKLNNLRKNLEPYKRWCTIWEKDITILPEILKQQNIFDFIFIDTLHDAKTANYYTKEINIWDHLNPGGILQLHDIWKDGGKESIFVMDWLQKLDSCAYWFPIYPYVEKLKLNTYGIRSKSDFRYPMEKAVWAKKMNNNLTTEEIKKELTDAGIDVEKSVKKIKKMIEKAIKKETKNKKKK